jgi:hypothetical protein
MLSAIGLEQVLGRCSVAKKLLFILRISRNGRVAEELGLLVDALDLKFVDFIFAH